MKFCSTNRILTYLQRQILLFIKLMVFGIHNVLSRNLYRCQKGCLLNTMSGKKNKKKLVPTQDPKETNENIPISYDSNSNVLIKILAKPGAKQNCITDVSEEGISIQINASPVEGQANTELLKYISVITGVKKGDISLIKGAKSRQKTVCIQSGVIKIEEVLDKFRTNQ